MKNKIFKIFIFIAILVLSFLIIKSTYSKYANSAQGTINETVGAWIVKINGVDMTENNGKFEIDNFQLDENSAVNSHINGPQMAPGTVGRFNITLDPTGTDVSLKYKITIDTYQFVSNILTDIGLVPNLEENREKINIAVDEVKINDVPIDITLDADNKEISISKIKRLQTIKSTLASDRVDNIEIAVKWNDNRANDKTDLLIGNLKDYKLKLPITVNAIQWYEFLKFSNFDKITEETCLNYDSFDGSSYQTLYSGNNEQLEYDANGNIKFDSDNPILYYEIQSGSNMFADEYSAQLTVNCDTTQGSETYGNTIFSIGNAEQNSYLSWISIYNGYLHVYSYRDTPSIGNCNYSYTEPGFLSYDISAFRNQVCNIQVSAQKSGNTTVYINGEEISTFQSGGATIDCTQATIGDLRPLRGLKYQGTVYDFAMYDRLLTEDEIQANWLDVQERLIY